MAKKNTEITAEQASEALEILTAFVAQQGGETSSEETSEETEKEETEKEEGEESSEDSDEGTLELPSKEDLEEMDKAALVKLAEKIELDVSGLKEARIKELFSALIDVLSEEAADADDVNALASAFGLKPAKKQKETEAGIREFIENLGGEEAEEESEEKDADEDGEKEDAKDSDEDAEEGEEAEEVDEDEQKSRLAAYNKAAKKPLKKYSELEKLLNGNAWGEVYMGGKDEDEAYCCGLPLSEEEEVDGKSHGSCAVSGKHFLIDGEGNIEEYEVPEEKPAKKKLTIGKKK